MSATELAPFAFPATVTRASQAALLDLAKQRAPDSSIFEQFPPYFFRARISTDQLDSYFTRMRPSSLKNYAADAETGVAFQDSHKTDGLVRTLGHSLTGAYAGPQGNGVAHTDADFYTVQGMDPTIDSFINKQRAGITRDVSIGFYGGRQVCSICGKDMLDWGSGCYHYPGMSYTPRDEEGRKIKDAEPVLCTADVEDAHLAEVSTVYDGATPGAVILKAQQAASDGRMKPETARLLESRYRSLDLSQIQHVHPAVVPEQEEHGMADKEQERSHAQAETSEPSQSAGTQSSSEREAASLLSRVRSALGIADTDDPAEAATRLRAELERLRPLADDGRAYRKELVDTAIAEGVRAFGASWNQEQHRALLENLPLDTARAMRDAWNAIGDKQFAGGRQTVDEDERQQPGAGTQAKAVPDAAFRAGR